MATLEINNLQARVAEEDGEQILRGVDLQVNSGEIHALMGPNGSGKSTTAKVIAGHPSYEVTGGEVLLQLEENEFGDDIDIDDDDRTWSLLDLEPNERAALGIFLGFQYPAEIEGVTMTNFLRTALNAKLDEREELFEEEDADSDAEEEQEELDADDAAGYESSPMEGPTDDGEIGVAEFQQLLNEKMELLDMDEKFMQRYLNAGFSGGEKNKMRFFKQPSLSLLLQSLMRLTLDLILIDSRMSPQESMHFVMSRALESSRLHIINEFSTTSNPIMFTSCSTERLRKVAMRHLHSNSKMKDMIGSVKRSMRQHNGDQTVRMKSDINTNTDTALDI